MCWTCDGEVWWSDVLGFDSIRCHFVQIRCVHITVIIPAETVKGDEQDSVATLVYGSTLDRQSPRNAQKTYGPCHGWSKLTVTVGQCENLNNVKPLLFLLSNVIYGANMF